ncbi:MAG: pentapeptide repeat-containing protein [Thermodesulfobacteriota bacterium]
MTKQYGNWCKHLPSKYRDGEGNKYCILHLPKWDLNEFNELIYDEIDLAWEESRPCDLSGTVFQGAISFSRYDKDHPLPELNLNDAIFIGGADFSKTRFGGKTGFRKTNFQGATTFEDAVFDDEVHFEEAHFRGETSFDRTEFKGKARFFDSTFEQKVTFEKAVFWKEMYLSWGSFKAGAELGSVTYHTNPVLKRPPFGSNTVMNTEKK